MKSLDPESSYRALQSRNRHFDGRLFFGITSTGIYCRPVCPAKTAKFENCRCFFTAAAAQEAGFRPCLRCRPEIAPETPGIEERSEIVSRGLAMISEGYLDGDGSKADRLAERLGVEENQLQRLFEEHVGASPSSVAKTRRVLFAKQLIHETDLSITDVAAAAGFDSLQTLTNTFKELFHRQPADLRHRRPNQRHPATSSTVSLFISYRPPYDWEHILSHLQARAIDGVEQIISGTYRRTFSFEGDSGIVDVSNDPVRRGLNAKIRFPCVRALAPVLSRLRRLFDVNADTSAVEKYLSNDKQLARLIERRPGLRVPGAWEGFELAVRAVLGQQITVRGAQQLAGKLVRLCHGPSEGLRALPLEYVFPSPSQLAAADLSQIGMPDSRRNTLKSLAAVVIADPAFFEATDSLDLIIQKLRAVPGIGEWTAQYIALRAFGANDAFPATDVVILRGAKELRGIVMSPEELVQRAESWRPWRAYAAQHLWATGGEKASIAEQAST
jgi:AraC family transcriptional regulator, regulatory protein of adaptative response / DNA-3-methyladenine glycosylase II